MNNGQRTKIMNCENLQSNLPLYIDDVLSETERASIEGHLPTCPLCRQTLSEYKDLRNDLRMFARPVIPAELLNSVKKSIANELNQPTITTGTEVLPTFSEKLAHWILPYSVGTVAASLFAFFFITVLVTSKDATSELIAQNQESESSTIMVAQSNSTTASQNLSLTTEVNELSLSAYPPKVNPSGALVALTKSIVRGKMSEEEVVIVADVFNNGVANIHEVVEPPSDDKAMLELQNAFKTNSQNTPFLPAKYSQTAQSTTVIIKLQRVDVQ